METDAQLEARAIEFTSTHPEARDIIGDLLDRISGYRSTVAAIARRRTDA